MMWEWAHPRFKSLRVCARSDECCSGSTLQRGTPHRRMEAAPSGGARNLEPVRYRRSRSVRFEGNNALSSLLLHGEGRSPLGIDAMAHRWLQGLLYAFPPFVLLHPLLQRVQVEEVSLILVAPNWPQMTWFSAIAPLLQGQPWELPGQRDLLSQAHRTHFHPFPQGLRLWAWALRGPSF